MMEMRTAEYIFDFLIDHIERSAKTTLAVLRLHRPRGMEYRSPACEGCDGDRNTQIDWPCSTIKTIATAEGLSHILENP